MATIISHHILSPAGEGTSANSRAVMEGATGLRGHENALGLPFAFTAALFADCGHETADTEGLTRFERMAVASIRGALAGQSIPLDARTLLVIATTKGNVSLLRKDSESADEVTVPGLSARKIAQAIGLSSEPLVVCNACISGVSAMITASRLIETGDYDYAIVCGIDEQSRFIISGFQSFHALSATECRPFDLERLGLNLGEAAATVIMGRDSLDCEGNLWHITAGAVRNDAYHLSTPHPKGEGAWLALESVLKRTPGILPAMVNAHGTATMYNDQMESKAIARAGLSEVPANAYKGTFGHTMGAAGVLETIVSMYALDRGVVPGTRNFCEAGVSGKMNLSADNRTADRRDFIKMISGFGGCNASIRVAAKYPEQSGAAHRRYAKKATVTLTPGKVNGEDFRTEGDMLTALYRKEVGDYPKFHKMDGLSKLAFLATELLLKQDGVEKAEGSDSRAVVFVNTRSSLHADKLFLDSIADEENFFPSPSIFLYTLPNVAAGEVALRNNWHGETGFYLMAENDSNLKEKIIRATLADPHTESLVFGYVEYLSPEDFTADVAILEVIDNG